MAKGPAGRNGSRKRRLAIALALAGIVAAPALAQPVVAIRFHDDNRLAQGAALSASAHAELERAARTGLVPLGRDTDGAFRFSLPHAASAAAVRDALNRVRATGGVVYADVVATGTAPRSADGPVTSFIVSLEPSAKRAGGGLATDTRARLAQKAGGAVSHSRALADGSHVIVLDAPLSAQSAQAALAKIAADPDVARVEIDRRAYVTAMPSDPMLPQQWNLIDAAGGINAPRAWDLATGDPGIPVAVLDTGILAHPDLAGRVVAGYDFIADVRFANDGDGRDADPSDPGDWVTSAESATVGGPYQACAVTNSTWHGTSVAGTLGAAVNNGTGVSGVNWSSPIVNVRVLGKCGGALSDVADGLRWAAGLPVPGVPANPRPARVINLSMAGPGPCGPTLQSAVTDALAQGAVLVAAAGNGNDDVENYWPANCSGVIAVTATSRNGSRAFYASHGERVALAAPGGGIGGSIPTLRNSGTTVPDAAGYGYGQQVGSSLAAPHVSGALSLALAVDADLGAAELRWLFEATARPFPTVPSEQCTPSTCGAGIVDAADALSTLASRAPIDAKPAPAPSPAPVAPPATEAPPPNVAPIPSAFPVPIGSGWRAKDAQTLRRILKDDAAATIERASPRALRAVER